MLQAAHGARAAPHDNTDFLVGEALEKPQRNDYLLIVTQLMNRVLDILAQGYVITLVWHLKLRALILFPKWHRGLAGTAL